MDKVLHLACITPCVIYMLCKCSVRGGGGQGIVEI